MKYRASVNLRNTRGGSPLTLAALGHNHGGVPSYKSVAVLLEARADPDAQDFIGESSLIIVVGKPEGARCVRALIAAAADVNLCNATGISPLESAWKS